MTYLVIDTIDGNEWKRTKFDENVNEDEQCRALLPLIDEVPEGAVIYLELEGGHRVAPRDARSVLTMRRIPSFVALAHYQAQWYARDIVAGKRILPWHRDYCSMPTDAGNAAVVAMIDRMVISCADEGLDCDQAKVLAYEEIEKLAEYYPDIHDSVTRDTIWERLETGNKSFRDMEGL